MGLEKIIFIVNRCVVNFCYKISTILYREQLEDLESVLVRYDTEEIKYNEFIECLILAEDKRFLFHPGFDVIAICRAIFFRLSKGVKSGASTIDQQLVRTITDRREKRLRRKLFEIVLASAINKNFTKVDIAVCYLKYAYYGWRMNGFYQAIYRLQHSKLYQFDICYLCAALLKYPLLKDPSEDRIGKIEGRVRYIIKRKESVSSYLYSMQ